MKPKILLTAMLASSWLQAWTLSTEQGQVEAEATEEGLNWLLDWPRGQASLTLVPDGCEQVQLQSAVLSFADPLTLTGCTEYQLSHRVISEGLYRYNIFNDQLTVSRIQQISQTNRTRPLPNLSCPIEPLGQSLVIAELAEHNLVFVDALSGQSFVLEQGVLDLSQPPENQSLLLLELAEQQTQEFDWRNALVYMIVTDRFANGRKDNDLAYGRQRDGQQEIGTFHGGDIAGVIERLDYLADLGVTALWLTPLVEQIHGFVGGGEGDFPFYAYHGYWAKDFTELDANFGTRAELAELVQQAHARGIRILFDVVLNHSGYANLADLQQYAPEVVADRRHLPDTWTHWRPAADQNWHSWTDWVDWQHPDWHQWWGPDWVRGLAPGFEPPGTGDLKGELAGLPDFLTENDQPVALPPLLVSKGSSAPAVEQSVIDHLIDWHVAWVREFGINGFRADTVKHIEAEHWQRLKDKASLAYQDWYAEQKDPALPYEPFWLLGEVWNHGAHDNFWFDYGFDALINFDWQQPATEFSLCLPRAESTYSRYAKLLQNPRLNFLSYASSHDTRLFFAQFEHWSLQQGLANALLLTPGAVQIYYGDEIGRAHGPYGSDHHQGTRSSMNWQFDERQQALLQHWQQVGQFRMRNPAVGAGEHILISQQPYAFMRQLGENRVIVVQLNSTLSSNN